MELILNNLKNKAKRCNINTWVLCICSSTVITERKKLSSSSFLTWQKLYSYRTNRQFVGRVTFWAVHYSKLPCFVTWPHATATQLKTPGLSLICGSKLLSLNCTIQKVQKHPKSIFISRPISSMKECAIFGKDLFPRWKRICHEDETCGPRVEAPWGCWQVRSPLRRRNSDFEQHWRKNDLAENENVDGNGNLF